MNCRSNACWHLIRRIRSSVQESFRQKYWKIDNKILLSNNRKILNWRLRGAVFHNFHFAWYTNAANTKKKNRANICARCAIWQNLFYLMNRGRFNHAEGANKDCAGIINAIWHLFCGLTCTPQYCIPLPLLFVLHKLFLTYRYYCDLGNTNLDFIWLE